MFVVTRRFQRNELLGRSAESDENKIPFGDGRPGGRDAQWYRQNL